MPKPLLTYILSVQGEEKDRLLVYTRLLEKLGVFDKSQVDVYYNPCDKEEKTFFTIIYGEDWRVIIRLFHNNIEIETNDIEVFRKIDKIVLEELKITGKEM